MPGPALAPALETLRRLHGLAAEFRDGGVEVEGDGLRIVLQLDGDLQICLMEEFRNAGEAARRRRLEARFEELEARLASLRQLDGAIRALRIILIALAALLSAGTEAVRVADGVTFEPASAWPHAAAALLAGGGLLARRAFGALLRRCLRF